MRPEKGHLTMIRMIIACVLMSLMATGVFAQEQDVIDKAAHEYITGSKKHPISAVFHAACTTSSGLAELVFREKDPTGRILEFEDGRVVNQAVVILKSGKIVLDFDNTQGGLYTYNRILIHANELSKSPFYLSTGNIEKEVFHATPAIKCSDPTDEQTPP